MPLGTCDPASRGMAYNEGGFSQFNGLVVCDYRYGWDGTSTRDVDPGCTGPLIRVRGANLSTTNTYYVHFLGRKGAPVTLALPPGFDQTYNAQQCRQRGLNTNLDLENLFITDSPTPPPALLAK